MRLVARSERVRVGMTVAEVDNFRKPFVGYLPGLADVAEDLGSGPWSSGIGSYMELLHAQWRRLIDSREAADERLLQAFLERHPSLLPGSHTVDHSSGHWPFPFAVISQPRLPGLSTKIPDFMWIASDSASVYPVLIEIETPHKRWFHSKGAEFHSDFTHALGQLTEWAAWFSRGTNAAAFMDYYSFPEYLRELALRPRYVLIHGRRAEYEHDVARKAKIAQVAQSDQRLMSFNRLAPELKATCVGCVQKQENGYRAICVPPTFSVSTGDLHRTVPNWLDVVERCEDMPTHRKQSLRDGIYREPEYKVYPGGLRTHKPRWY